MSRISETTHGALTIHAGILVQQSSHPAHQQQLWPAWGHWCWCLSHQLPPPGQTQPPPAVPGQWELPAPEPPWNLTEI